MSTDPRNLKIRIVVSGPSSAPAVEIPATAETHSRLPMLVAGVVVAFLIAGWGLWALFTPGDDLPASPVAVDTSPSIATPAVETPKPIATAPVAIEPANAAPVKKTPAVVNAPAPEKGSRVSNGGTNLVVRALLTDKMRNRQPANELSGEIAASDVTRRFYFFTEVHDVASRRFTHRWEYRGKPVANVPFKPSGKNWSTASSKQIPNHMQGEWRAVLVDDQGHELTSVEFAYGTDASAVN